MQDRLELAHLKKGFQEVLDVLFSATLDLFGGGNGECTGVKQQGRCSAVFHRLHVTFRVLAPDVSHNSLTTYLFIDPK